MAAGLAQECDLPGLPNAFNSARNIPRIDVFGDFAFQAEKDGPIGAVTTSGERERSEELYLDASCLLPESMLVERFGEAARGPHGTDGVRAGGPNPNREEIEDTDRHNSTWNCGTNPSCLVPNPKREARNKSQASNRTDEDGQTQGHGKRGRTIQTSLFLSWKRQREDFPESLSSEP